jgi:hypothetical protein
MWAASGEGRPRRPWRGEEQQSDSSLTGMFSSLAAKMRESAAEYQGTTSGPGPMRSTRRRQEAPPRRGRVQEDESQEPRNPREGSTRRHEPRRQEQEGGRGQKRGQEERQGGRQPASASSDFVFQMGAGFASRLAGGSNTESGRTGEGPSKRQEASPPGRRNQEASGQGLMQKGLGFVSAIAGGGEEPTGRSSRGR